MAPISSLDINGNYTSSGSVTANINGGTIEIAGDWDGTSGSGFDPSGGTVFLMVVLNLFQLMQVIIFMI